MNPAGSYFYPAADVEDETVVNKSRFICYLDRSESPASAKAHLQRVKLLHPEARHHCVAFIAGAPENSQCYGFSDDGEPAGTAGRPMMSVLQGSQIGEISAVVVRYFGGIKLGTGGLQRAYGGSVRQALTLLSTKLKVPQQRLLLTCGYELSQPIERLISAIDGSIISQEFSEKVNMTIAVPVHQYSTFSQQATDISAGKLIVKKID